ncbi:MAG: RagB/SusD family nutrient uptake outer membrane protein [Mangrovibacterium sp.]
MKNKILRYIAFVVVWLNFSSCDKLLDVTPTDFLTQTNFYNSEDDLNNALTGIYETLGRQAIYRGYGNGLFGLNPADEALYSSSSQVHIRKYNSPSDNNDLLDIWRNLYYGIEKANMLLDNIDKPEMDASKRAVIKGEAQFLRAYYYFLLVSNWGDVPVRKTQTTSVSDTKYGRTPTKEIYQFIVDEMEQAENLVLPITSYNYAGRISKSAVQGVLARVNLYWAGDPCNETSRYAEAYKWAKKVIDSGIHSLNPSFRDVFINFIQDKYDIKESIWEVEFYSEGATDPYQKYGQHGISYGIAQNTVEYGYASATNKVSDTLFNKFDALDLRRNWSIANYSYYQTKTQTRLFFTPRDLVPRTRGIGKWRREYELQANKVKAYCSTNLSLLRYSDVLLMAAEASNAVNGPITEAIEWVNMVRRRGYGLNQPGKRVISFTIVNGGAGYNPVAMMSNSKPPVFTVERSDGDSTKCAVGIAVIDAVNNSPTRGSVIDVWINDCGDPYPTDPTKVTVKYFYGSTGNDAKGSGAVIVPVLKKLTNSDVDLPLSYTGTKEHFLQAIKDERMRELCFEGFRRNDLIRWGDFVLKMNALGTAIAANPNLTSLNLLPLNLSYPKNIYFPIPQSEINLNPLLTQNEGW